MTEMREVWRFREGRRQRNFNHLGIGGEDKGYTLSIFIEEVRELSLKARYLDIFE